MKIYKVSSSSTEYFYADNLNGTSLLTVAEEEAKKQTKNQATRYIHRHTLEVIKTFKVEDKPRQTALNKNVCNFEGCNGAPVLESGTATLCDYCHLHAGIVWHGRLAREFSKGGKYTEVPYFTMPKTTKTKAERLLRRVVSYYENSESYSDAHDRQKNEFMPHIREAKIVPAVYPRRTPQTMALSHKEDLRQLCYTIVKAGELV